MQLRARIAVLQQQQAQLLSQLQAQHVQQAQQLVPGPQAQLAVPHSQLLLQQPSRGVYMQAATAAPFTLLGCWPPTTAAAADLLCPSAQPAQPARPGPGHVPATGHTYMLPLLQVQYMVGQV